MRIAATQMDMFAGLPSYTCRCCHKPLTDPTSIKLGMGPICRARERVALGFNEEKETQQMVLDTPIEDGLILSRIEGVGVATNVPVFGLHHSPTGFEFGYGGSGPADLALNAVELVLRKLGYTGPLVDLHHGKSFLLSYRLHQDFKWQFIASAPHMGANIEWETIKEWVSSRIPAPGEDDDFETYGEREGDSEDHQ